MKKICLVILGTLMLVGCGVQSVDVKKYNPPKASATSAITGAPLRIKYSVGSASGTMSYHLYDSNNRLLGSTSAFDKKLYPLLKVGGRVRFLGTLGDKVIFVFQNSLSEFYLSVYDHSENKTYHLLGVDEKFSILKSGNSYVIKNITKNKYISVNNLKEVNINESSYRPVIQRWFGHDIKRYSHILVHKYTVLTPKKAWNNIKTADEKEFRLGNGNYDNKAEPLMISTYPLQKIRYGRE